MGRIAKEWKPWVVLARSIIFGCAEDQYNDQHKRVLAFEKQLAKEAPAIRHIYRMALTVGQLLFERSVEGRRSNEIYPLPLCFLSADCKSCLFIDNRIGTCRFLADPGKNFKRGIKLYNAMVQGLHREEKKMLFGDRI